MPANDKPTPARILREAKRFLGRRERHSREANLTDDLAALFGGLGAGSVESEYPAEGGRADLYLPNQRMFIEAKAAGKAENPDAARPGTGESPRDQLTRYVRGEIGREKSWSIDDASRSDREWTGVITDGGRWHVYRYAHETDSRPRPVETARIDGDSPEKLAALVGRLLDRWIGKEWIPADPSGMLQRHRKAVESLYRNRPPRAKAKIETKRRLWLDMIKASGMVPRGVEAQERLFVAHSFLIAVVRLVRATRDASLGPFDAVRDGFASWLLDFAQGRSWVRDLAEAIDGRDWVRRRTDVIREIYVAAVAGKDRKLFGEFYTPDWLAEMMVTELLDEEWLERSIEAAERSVSEGTAPDGAGVLDPACGSGTFLYHAASRLMGAAAMDGLSPVEKADIAARLVNGIDIHPIAVEMAKANLIRALPAMPSQGDSALRVFVGDSLQAANKGGGELFVHSGNHMYLTTPGGREIAIPMKFVRSPSFPNHMRRLVDAAAAGKGMPKILQRIHPGGGLRECHRQLSDAIESEGNSVWTWYAINVAGPHLLAERKVDRIVANPPWVKLSAIQVEDRKRTMERLGEALGVQAGGRQAPHLDIACFFILRARELYMADRSGNPAAWLVKKSALRSGNWERFRALQRKKGAIAQTVDLEKLAPFGGGDARRPCLLMERRKLRVVDQSRSRALVAAPSPGGRRPGRGERWAEAGSGISFSRAPRSFPDAPSAYFETGRRFRQGATITPSVLLLADDVRRAAPGLSRVRTRKSAKNGWEKTDVQTGDVPDAWLKELLYSDGLLPFIADFRRRRAVIPVDGEGELHPDPGAECPFWLVLNEIYETKMGKGKSTPKTLMEQIDHHGKASRQLPVGRKRGAKTMVLYPASADIMRAARTRPGAALVDSKLYWRVCGAEAEAGYLTAVLNASCLRRAFEESRESGRDFHLHPWRKVPVPEFRPSSADHKRLAALCAAAESFAAAAVGGLGESDRNRGQRWLSGRLRDGLGADDAGKEIDEICRRLLPKHADGDAG